MKLMNPICADRHRDKVQVAFHWKGCSTRLGKRKQFSAKLDTCSFGSSAPLLDLSGETARPSLASSSP